MINYQFFQSLASDNNNGKKKKKMIKRIYDESDESQFDLSKTNLNRSKFHNKP